MLSETNDRPVAPLNHSAGSVTRWALRVLADISMRGNSGPVVTGIPALPSKSGESAMPGDAERSQLTSWGNA